MGPRGPRGGTHGSQGGDPWDPIGGNNGITGWALGGSGVNEGGRMRMNDQGRLFDCISRFSLSLSLSLTNNENNF